MVTQVKVCKIALSISLMFILIPQNISSPSQLKIHDMHNPYISHTEETFRGQFSKESCWYVLANSKRKTVEFFVPAISVPVLKRLPPRDSSFIDGMPCFQRVIQHCRHSDRNKGSRSKDRVKYIVELHHKSPGDCITKNKNRIV